MKIVEVIPSTDYLVTIRFDNSYSVTIDMKKKLHTVRFSELIDEQLFFLVKADGKAIVWPGGISIAISEIMEMIAT